MTFVCGFPGCGVGDSQRDRLHMGDVHMHRLTPEVLVADRGFVTQRFEHMLNHANMAHGYGAPRSRRTAATATVSTRAL